MSITNLKSKLQQILDSKNAIRDSLGNVVEDRVSRQISKYSDIIRNITPVNDKVNFRDYDGSLIKSYPVSDFLQLTEMPELPAGENVTYQEWNYTLDDAKTYVQKYGLLDIGAICDSSDGKTRLYLDIVNECTVIPVHYYQSAANGVTINWGDGSDESSLSSTGDVQISHVYVNPGKYTITLTINSGTVRLGHKTASCNVLGLINTAAVATLYKAEIGTGLTTIDDYAFQYCVNLDSIVISRNVTSIGQYAFYNCASLFGVVLSKSLKSIGNYAFKESGLNVALMSNGITSIGQYAFNKCYSLESLFIPTGITTMGVDAFYDCYSLETVMIPEGFTAISNYMFYNCKNLNKINIPSTVTSIGTYAFYGCNNLENLNMPAVTSIGTYAFYECFRLSNLILPNITAINDYTFYNCSDLNELVIPNTVKTIGKYAFYNCSDLNITSMSQSLTSIGDNAFSGCKSMQVYDFTGYTSIPTLSNINSLTDMPVGCEIRVPATLYSSWKSATNWSTYDNYMIPVGDNIAYFLLNSENNNYKKYYFEKGMTWSQWFESNYNIKGFTIDNFISEIIETDPITEKSIYEIKMGVYIVSLDGGLYDADEWSAGSNATGVAVITDNGSWIVALDEWYSSSESTAWNGNIRSAWGGYNKTITDIKTITSSSEAILDFDGRRNTDIIISQLSGTTDDYSSYYTGAPAAEYCRAYSKGYKGAGSWYLPAAGELNEIVLNKDAINTALTKLGKNSLSKKSYTWSSSQYNSGNAWSYYWSYSNWEYSSKSYDRGVRPITQLNNIRIINFKIDGTTYQAEEGMDWAWWINSIYNTSGYSITNILGASKNGVVQENVEYETIASGIYVVYSDGTYELSDNMSDTTTADNVTGIGLVTDKVKMIVALDEWYSSSESTAWNGNIRSAWGGYNKTVTGCFINSDQTQALLDFNGEANTDAIINQLKGTTDSYSQYYTGAPAAEYCRAYSKGYKDVGSWYLPAAGELNEIVLNKDAINAILTKLGKNNLSKNSYTWSSSQYSSTNAWGYYWSGSLWNYDYKYGDDGVRPISNLTSPGNIIQFSINGTVFNAVEGTTFKQWCGGIYNTNNYRSDRMVGINENDIIQAGNNYEATILENGVYVVYSDGTYELSDNMSDTTVADDVTGIGLVTDKVKTIVALDEWYSYGNKRSAWGGYGKIVTGCFTNTNQTRALLDFNGEANTDAIIAQLKDTTDSYSSYYTGAPAAEYCRAYSKGYKDVGSWYLPAAGELNEIGLNKDAINTILTKLGKKRLSNNSGSYPYTWSSSQYGGNEVWTFNGPGSSWYRHYKNSDLGVRPISNFTLSGNIIQFSINGTTYNAVEGTTFKQWCSGIYNTNNYGPHHLVGINENDIIQAGNNYEVTILENGVYVVDLEGNLLDSNTFTGTADDVTGIGLVTDKVKMIVALDEWYSYSESTAWNGNTNSAWGGYNKTVTGCFINNDQTQALLDFNGEANTDAIISQLSGTTDNYSQYYTGAPAAEYCRAYSKGYKDVGSWYLPAAGELNEIVLNKDAINAILTKLGKNNLSKNSYTWSSSQSNSNSAWRYRWSKSNWYTNSKDSNYGVRPVCAF